MALKTKVGGQTKIPRSEPLRPALAGGVEFHPLLPGLAEKPGKTVYFIRVNRYEPEVNDFAPCPREFKPSELGTLAELQRQFGGGRYDLWGLDEIQRIVTKAQWTLAGDPVPMPGVYRAPVHTPSAAPAAAPAAPSTDSTLLMLLIKMMSDERANSSAQQQNFMQIMMKSMETASNRDPLGQLVTALAPLAPSFLSRASGAPAASPIVQFKELLELQKTLGVLAGKKTGETTAEEIQAVAGVAKSIVEGLTVFAANDAAKTGAVAEAEKAKAEAAKAQSQAAAMHSVQLAETARAHVASLQASNGAAAGTPPSSGAS